MVFYYPISYNSILKKGVYVSDFSNTVNSCGAIIKSAQNMGIWSSVSYVFTALFTDIHPMTAATTVGLAVFISDHVTQPLFKKIYKTEYKRLKNEGKKFITLLSRIGSYFPAQYLVDKLGIDVLADKLLFGACPTSRSFVHLVLTATKLSFLAVIALLVCGYLYKQYHEPIGNYLHQIYDRIKAFVINYLPIRT